MEIKEQVEKSRLSGCMDYFSHEKLPKQKGWLRLGTGFPGLDGLLGGGISPGVLVLGAISNLGKSTWVLQIAQHVAAEGNPVLYFSLEMPRIRVASKAVSRQIFVDAGCAEERGTWAVCWSCSRYWESRRAQTFSNSGRRSTRTASP